MNSYLTFRPDFGYQIIARNSRNQTFYWSTVYKGVANSNLPKVVLFNLQSDLNYQLAIL